MVGTCNGLICLHEQDAGLGAGSLSAITVANPVTGETQALPTLPAAWDPLRRLGLYAFGYHPTTGQYKVVHVPSRRAPRQDAVHVLTLGDPAAWREVVDLSRAPAAMGGSYNPCCGIVSVDGSVYWLASCAERVMALDLEDESLASFHVPPTVVRPVGPVAKASWKLTSVHSRLGVTVAITSPAGTTVVEVWFWTAAKAESRRGGAGATASSRA
ncbi:hypothetical protein BAE44_0016856 [Dichanthelium oligosanthes]|uniref:F-box associated beta-propeller type 3 domain-containing protein n=1 Tax=Dichanthelium oligosanthes TaxID=888268 RepID=A0A1E5VAS7_9POAL|nr:hypothetical protein BAE44_0016856 [Dichanthelium oligosanthes]